MDGDFPGGSDGKEFVCSAGDQVRFLGWEDPLEKGMATHAMENPLDRGAWWAIVQGVTKSRRRLCA